LSPATPEHRSSIAPWYRGSGPEGKDNRPLLVSSASPPKTTRRLAFAVMAEYGGSGNGGRPAAVAREAMAACVRHYYLSP